MTRKEAIKKLFSFNQTETLFGRETARANRALVRKREAARANRAKQRNG